jgi:hypothetical protein
VLAVRDLASGQQLAWRPVADLSAGTLLPELGLLFTVYGAPWVLKSDNGSAFRAEVVKGFRGRWQVWPLYPPPGARWYNCAIEASIGSLKRRTQFAAWHQGRPGAWTSADLERVRELANTTARVARSGRRQTKPGGPGACQDRMPGPPSGRGCGCASRSGVSRAASR